MRAVRRSPDVVNPAVPVAAARAYGEQGRRPARALVDVLLVVGVRAFERLGSREEDLRAVVRGALEARVERPVAAGRADGNERRRPARARGGARGGWAPCPGPTT